MPNIQYLASFIDLLILYMTVRHNLHFIINIATATTDEGLIWMLMYKLD